MSAEEAMQLGFASRVVAKETLLDTAFELAETMAAKNPLGLKMTKEAINQNLGVSSLEQALHVENRNQAFMITAMKVQPPSAD
jgi:enoyl-CoA hydratase/carnithine racemase